MQDNRFMNTAAATAAQTDVGLRAYMLGVYNHMTTALLLTGFFAFATKWAVLNVAGLGQLLYGTPLKWVIMLAPLGMVIWLSARINRMSATKARNLFYIYGAIMGLSLASILFVYTGASVARAFFITAGAFAGLSLYGYSTKRSLSAMGSFMMIGLIWRTPWHILKIIECIWQLFKGRASPSCRVAWDRKIGESSGAVQLEIHA